jgi:hypothetical protein
VLRVPARPASVALGALLLSVVVGVSPALASERKATGQDSAGDGQAGSNRDIVSTSFDYDDSGKVELTVTMAAPIDPQNARFRASWALSEANANHECDGRASRTVIQYDTNGSGVIYVDTGQPGAAPPRHVVGAARIDGATLVYDLSDSVLAGHQYSCLDAEVASVSGDPQGANTSYGPGDSAAAAVAGFNAPGPIVNLLDGGRPIVATSSGVVRLTFSARATDRAKGVVTLRTAKKVQSKPSKPRHVLKLGAGDVAISQYGETKRSKIPLTKEGRAFLKRAGRVAVVATIVAEDAQGRKSTTEQKFTLKSAQA